MPEKFFWLAALLADKYLSASAKNVATRLMLHHNEKTGQCNPSHQRLADGLGLTRKYVCRLVGELVAGGWIETTGTPGASHYRLQLDRAATVAEGPADEPNGADPGEGVPTVGDRGCPQLAAGGAPNCEQGVLTVGGTEPSKEPSKRTIQLNPEPAEAAIEPEMKGPAHVSVIPVQPVPTPPLPANDDGASGVVEIDGLKIPGTKYQEWEQAFREIDLRSEILDCAKWAIGIHEKREGHRLQAVQTLLRKRNAAVRENRIRRKENKVADVAAGVERDEYGRVKGRPVANSRYAIPDAPGSEKVHRGPGYSLTRAELDRIKAKWPDLDVLAAIAAFDREKADAMIPPDQNHFALAAFLDAKEVTSAALANVAD